MTQKLMVYPKPSYSRKSHLLISTLLVFSSHGSTALADDSVVKNPPPTDLMVVFDGSGSMWGQMGEQTKIETARDVLSSVLGDIDPTQQMGLIAYGHREKGNCADIETLVELGPAPQTVPRMISAAKGLNPKGKTPISEAVSLAAQQLRFTENAATVVLITDGLETCNADPCALGKQLEADGLDFTTHVIGFGLGEAESEQLSCLARETGGEFLTAETADQLESALAQTVSAEPASDRRAVEFIFRDSPETDLLGIRQLQINLTTAEGEDLGDDVISLLYTEVNDVSARAELAPGDYVANIDRGGSSPYSVAYSFSVPEGEGLHSIEANLVGRLILNPFVNPTLAYDPNNPPVAALAGKAWAYFSVFPMVDGEVSEEPVVEDVYKDFDFPLVPGRYLLRGSLGRLVAIEQEIEVQSGAPTTVDISFDATPVTIIAEDETGQPVDRQSTFFYVGEPKGRDYFRRGGGHDAPHFMPNGLIGINVGAEGGGETRGQIVFEPDGRFEPVIFRVPPGDRAAPDDLQRLIEASGCIDVITVKYSACLVGDSKGEEPLQIVDDVPPNDGPLIDQAIVFSTIDDPTLKARLAKDDVSGEVQLWLPNNWCMDRHGCPAITANLPDDIMTFLSGTDYRTRTLENEAVDLAIESFGEIKTLYVSEKGSGGRPVTRFEME